MKQLITKQHIVSQAILAGNGECKVLYNSAKDMIELEVGGTSLRIATTSFMMMSELMRKAAAKLVMQTELKIAVMDEIEIDHAPNEPLITQIQMHNMHHA